MNFDKLKKDERIKILMKVGEELQIIGGFEPPLNFTGLDEGTMISMLHDAFKLLEPSDRVTFVAAEVFAGLGFYGKKKYERKKINTDYKKPGITQTIANAIENAGDKGISKKEILTLLKTVFPDRNPKQMQATINTQLPYQISKNKFKVIRVGHRYFKAEFLKK